MRFMISFPIFLFLPAPPPTPPLSLPPPLLLFLHFFLLLPTLSIPFLPPFTFTLFSIFLFSLLLLSPLLLFLGSSAPQPISSLSLINILTQTFYLFLHSFPFPSSSPTITNLLSFKLISSEMEEYRCLNYFIHQNEKFVTFLRLPGRVRPQSSCTPVLSVVIVSSHFYFFISLFCIICCL